MHAFTFNTTPSIVFEPGAARRLGTVARRLGPSVLFVTENEKVPPEPASLSAPLQDPSGWKDASGRLVDTWVQGAPPAVEAQAANGIVERRLVELQAGTEIRA